MIVLSLHPGHNSTAVILKDSRILGVLSQEKMDNIKNSAVFPKEAILSLLQELNMTLSDIHQIVISGRDIYPSRCYDYLFDKNNEINSSFFFSLLKSIEKSVFAVPFKHVFSFLRRIRKRQLLSEGKIELNQHLSDLGLKDLPISFVDHHLCHAASS